mgnify:FL=1
MPELATSFIGTFSGSAVGFGTIQPLALPRTLTPSP